MDLLVLLGERLGREEAIEVLTNTLQGFFSCFSTVHSNEEETQLWGTPQNGGPTYKLPYSKLRVIFLSVQFVLQSINISASIQKFLGHKFYLSAV